MTRPTRPITPFLRLWGWPLLMAVLSATGLLSALASDSWGDWWSWLALGIPVGAMAWFGLPRGSRPAFPSPARRTHR